MILEKNLFKNI